MPAEPEPILSVRDVTVSFGDATILESLDLDMRPGEILGFVGGSGTGKSVLMRTILGLNKRQSGKVRLFGQDVDEVSPSELVDIDRRIGVLFQQGALFSGLTVRENIQFPMREYLDWPKSLMDEIADVKLDLVGLPRSAGPKMPSELSGGMIKRAALARSLALDPDLIFLDEPTSGLDPIGAADFDELIATLSETLGVSVYMVTHDLDSLHAVCDRVAVLGDRKVLAVAPVEEMVDLDHPWVQEYFRGKRSRFAPAPGRRAKEAAFAR